MNIIEIIKKSCIDVYNHMKPPDICIGIVINLNPLKIKISDKLILNENVLVFSKTVLGIKTESSLGILNTYHKHPECNFDSNTSHIHNDSLGAETTPSDIKTSHQHDESGIIINLEHLHKTDKIHIDDKLILIRELGGQRYFVIDKVGVI